MMMGLNKLGTAVTVIIAVAITALVAEIIYVLWRRRRVYLTRQRVEPKEPSYPTSSPSSSNSERDCELELQLEQQVMKYQSEYSVSRMLFTIKEEDEERDCCDSDHNNGDCSAIVINKNLTKTVSFRDVVINVDEFVSETTPFSTPCASPPYYTPHSSPARDNNDGGGNG